MKAIARAVGSKMTRSESISSNMFLPPQKGRHYRNQLRNFRNRTSNPFLLRLPALHLRQQRLDAVGFLDRGEAVFNVLGAKF